MGEDSKKDQVCSLCHGARTVPFVGGSGLRADCPACGGTGGTRHSFNQITVNDKDAQKHCLVFQ